MLYQIPTSTDLPYLYPYVGPITVMIVSLLCLDIWISMFWCHDNKHMVSVIYTAAEIGLHVGSPTNVEVEEEQVSDYSQAAQCPQEA